MRLGDVIESAIWLSGEETKELRARYQGDVCAGLAALCEQEGWLCGPVTFTEKLPEEDRVPPVPDHISGPNVRMLVANAEIIGKKPETSQGSFIANLDRKDLVKLRKLTRKAHTRMWGGSLNDRECDEIIEYLGPEAAIDTLRRRDTLH